jgi:ribulose-phosphate 3-epimerase
MSTRPICIAPSILSADFRTLEREVKMAQDSGADRIHCDIMDGHFVPNITFGSLVVEAVKKSVSIPLDVHLMISEPHKYIGMFCDAGADTLIVHAEACDDLPAILNSIRKRGVRTGATVNTETSVNVLIPHLRDMDQVLVMTVPAGFGAQKFMPEMLAKVKAIRSEAVTYGLSLDIEVDGGVNQETIELCAQNGANVFVAGNYVFKSPNYKERIDTLRNAANAVWKSKC